MRPQWAGAAAGGGGREGRTVTAVRAPLREPAEWPGHLPPFLSGGVTFASDGMLWVRRTVPADDPPAYDVIDGEGRVVHRVVLPQRARVLGFGRGTVYLVRLDDDDLQFVERHRLPTTGRP